VSDQGWKDKWSVNDDAFQVMASAAGKAADRNLDAISLPDSRSGWRKVLMHAFHCGFSCAIQEHDRIKAMCEPLLAQANDSDQPGVPASVTSGGSADSGRVASIPTIELKWLRDCSDLEMGDGDTARDLAAAWLGEEKPASEVITERERMHDWIRK
jgi:hypothetical protein